MPQSQPQPPAPGGILWDVAGDVRMTLALPSALVMQVAHPAVGAGVDQYSVFRTDPWGRGERSLHSAQLWVYGGQQAVDEGRRLRKLHATVRGVDTRGRPYRALDPDCYAWVHATGFPVYRHAQKYLGGRPFTPAQERQLYAEWLQVGRVLGLRDKDMPQNLGEFWPYYSRMLSETVEPTPVALEVAAAQRPVPPPPWGPAPLRMLVRAVWPVLGPLLARLRAFLTTGLMPPEAREAIGLPWSTRQERRLQAFGFVVRLVVPLLPERLRYLPLARKARREARRADPYTGRRLLQAAAPRALRRRRHRSQPDG